jgi:SPP1 gp7 family putative phage head morphogenesis protein
MEANQLRFPFWNKKVYTEEVVAENNPAPGNLGEILSSKSSLYPNSTFEPYNPDKLYQKRGSYDLLDKMRADDQIKPILEFKKSIVLGSGHYIDSDNNEIKEFWDYALSDYFEGQFQSSLFEMLSSIDFGFSISELIYKTDVIKELGNKPFWMLKNIKTRPPHSFELSTDNFGNLSKVTQWQQYGGQIEVPLDKIIHCTHLSEFGNPYGTSDLTVAVYRSWFSKDNIIRFWNIALERFSNPIPHAKYPKGAGKQTKDDLLKATKNFSAKDSIVTEDNITIELLRAEPQPQIFKEAIDTHDLRIARSMLMPDLLGLSGAQASSGGLGDSMGAVQFAIFMEVMKKIRNNLLALLNRKIIKPLTNYNFGEKEWAELKFRELTKQSEYEALRLFIEFVSKGGGKFTGEQQLWAADIIGAPTAKLEEMLESGELDKAPQPIIPPTIGPDGKPVIEPSPDSESDISEDTVIKKEDKTIDKQEKLVDKPTDKKVQENSFKYAEGKFSRPLTSFEKKVDFSAVDKTLEYLNATHADALGQTIKGMLGDLKDAIVRRKIIERKNYDAVNQLTIKGMPALRSAFTMMLKDAYSAGIDSAKPEAKKFAIFPTEQAAYEEVAQWLKNRTVYLADIEAEALLKIAKGTLMDGIRTGASLKDIISMLEDEYTAWDMMDAVGGGRIETIVRTNTLAAFNEARGQQFSKLGDAIIGYQYSAIMDSRVSEICAVLDEKFITPAEYSQFNPPNHYNCRSILVPIFHDEIEESKSLGEPPAVKREMGGFLTLHSENYFASGNWGHAGRPGEVGGSSPNGGGGEEDNGGGGKIGSMSKSNQTLMEARGLKDLYTAQSYREEGIVEQKKNDDDYEITIAEIPDGDKKIKILVDGNHSLQAAIKYNKINEIKIKYVSPQSKNLEDYVSGFGDLSNPINVITGNDLW